MADQDQLTLGYQIEMSLTDWNTIANKGLVVSECMNWLGEFLQEEYFLPCGAVELGLLWAINQEQKRHSV